MSLPQLILLAPLLTSTAYLQFATAETFFFSLFFRPSHSAKSAALLPSYLSHFSRPAVLIISAALGLQLVTSIAAATALYDGASASYLVSGPSEDFVIVDVFFRPNTLVHAKHPNPTPARPSGS